MKKGGLLNVGGELIPGIDCPFGDRNGIPLLVALLDAVVLLVEGGRIEGLIVLGRNLSLGWPDVLQEDVAAVGPLAQRLVHQIDIGCASQGVGHHQRR